MADEIISRDSNRVPVLAGVTDDSAQEIRQLRIDPSTGRLLISATVDGVVNSAASSTDNAVPRFDGTSGNALQNSTMTIDDNNAVSVGGQIRSTRYDAGDSGTALTINWNNGNYQKVTLTGNCTFTFTNPLAGARYVLELLQDATGSRTITLPAAAKHPAGSAPTLTTTAGRVDLLFLDYNGTSYAVTSALNFAL